MGLSVVCSISEQSQWWNLSLRPAIFVLDESTGNGVYEFMLGFGFGFACVWLAAVYLCK